MEPFEQLTVIEAGAGVAPVAPAYTPGFDVPRSPVPALPDQAWGEALVRDAARRLRRRPRDLRLHVQRIHALLLLGDSGSALVAAARELGTVLGTRGQALRERIDGWVAAAVDDADAAPIHGALAAPDAERGDVLIVEPVQAGEDRFADPLDYAVAMLEAGDYREAQDCLERAVRDAPEREALATELHGIYRAARDRESYGRLREDVLAAAPAAAAWWPDVERQFAGFA